MSIRITELDAITSLQDGDYVAIDNESNGTHKFKVLDISSNVANNISFSIGLGNKNFNPIFLTSPSSIPHSSTRWKMI